MYVWHVPAWCSCRPKEGVDSAGNGVTDASKMLNVWALNQTRLLCKNTKDSYACHHLFSP